MSGGRIRTPRGRKDRGRVPVGFPRSFGREVDRIAHKRGVEAGEGCHAVPLRSRTASYPTDGAVRQWVQGDVGQYYGATTFIARRANWRLNSTSESARS